jgi:hypothetical protein
MESTGMYLLFHDSPKVVGYGITDVSGTPFKDQWPRGSWIFLNSLDITVPESLA